MTRVVVVCLVNHTLIALIREDTTRVETLVARSIASGFQGDKLSMDSLFSGKPVRKAKAAGRGGFEFTTVEIDNALIMEGPVDSMQTVKLSTTLTAYLERKSSNSVVCITFLEPTKELRSIWIEGCQSVLVADICGYTGLEQILLFPSGNDIQDTIQNSVILDGSVVWMGKGTEIETMEGGHAVRLKLYSGMNEERVEKVPDWISAIEDTAREAIQANEKVIEQRREKQKEEAIIMKESRKALSEVASNPPTQEIVATQIKLGSRPSPSSDSDSTIDVSLLLYVGICGMAGSCKEVFLNVVEAPIKGQEKRFVTSIETRSGIVPSIDRDEEVFLALGASLKGISVNVKEVSVIVQGIWKVDGTMRSSVLSHLSLPSSLLVLPGSLKKVYRPSSKRTSPKLLEFRRPAVFEINWTGQDSEAWLTEAQASLKDTFHRLDRVSEKQYALFCYPEAQAVLLLLHLQESLPSDVTLTKI